MIYRVEVNTYGDRAGVWNGNAVTYPSAKVATEAAKDLFHRWTAVKFWRVIDDEGQVHATNEETV